MSDEQHQVRAALGERPLLSSDHILHLASAQAPGRIRGTAMSPAQGHARKLQGLGCKEWPG